MPRNWLAMLPRCPVQVSAGVFFLCNQSRSPCSRVAASLHRARDMMMDEARACGIPGSGAPECAALLVLLLCSGSEVGCVRGCATKGRRFTRIIIVVVFARGSQGATVRGEKASCNKQNATTLWMSKSGELHRMRRQLRRQQGDLPLWARHNHGYRTVVHSSNLLHILVPRLVSRYRLHV